MSLVELLVVISLIAILMVLAAPALVSITQGQGTKRAINDVSALLETARTEAMATSTWVWVGFASLTNANQNRELIVNAVSSKDGTTNTSLSNLSSMGRPIRIENVVLLSTLTQWATGTFISPLAGSTYNFQQTIGGQTQTFTNTVLAFSPQGEASINPNAISPWIEIGLRETRGGTEKTERTGSLKVSGLSGQVIVTY